MIRYKKQKHPKPEIGNQQILLPEMKYMNPGKLRQLSTAVLTSVLTYQMEAELYYKLDKAKGQLHSGHALKALLESGTDPEINDINRRIEAAGFIWALNGPTGKEYEIVSTRTMINAYRFLGGETFSRLLELMAGTWHGTPYSLRASIFSGLALFLKTYETELNDHAFMRNLSAVEPDEIIQLSKAKQTLTMRVARIIWDKFNSQQRESRKLAYRFDF